MVIRSFKAQTTIKHLDYFSKTAEAEEIGREIEIILTKIGGGNELRKLQLGKSKNKQEIFEEHSKGKVR